MEPKFLSNSCHAPWYDRESYRLHLWKSLKDSLKTMGIAEHNQSDALACIKRLLKLEIHFAYPGYELVERLENRISSGDIELAYITSSNITKSIESGRYRTPPSYSINREKEGLDRVNTSLYFADVSKTNTQLNKYAEVLFICDNHEKIRIQSFIDNDGLSIGDFGFRHIFAATMNQAISSLTWNPELIAVVWVDPVKSALPNRLCDKVIPIKPAEIDSKAILGSSKSQSNDNQSLKSVRSNIKFILLSQHPNSMDELEGNFFDRIFSLQNGLRDFRYYLNNYAAALFHTPFFDALREYSTKTKLSFHALPLSRAAAIANSNWLTDFEDFYGDALFRAETSSTQGGLDSLLDPKGPIKQACDKTAKTFGAEHSFLLTSGTSAANKIIIQANLNPGDIVLIAADCHKSIPYGVMMADAHAIYLETDYLEDHDLYTTVRLEQIVSVLNQLKEQNQLDRVKQISLTNCTFDGILYDVEHYMRVILSIKPDIIFHWDEAWFAHGFFNPKYAKHSSMKVANKLEKLLSSQDYLEQFLCKRQQSLNDSESPIPGWPDPTRAKIRVYATQSTHKSLSAFRQGAMIHIKDANMNHARFIESFRMHTTTSPNYQIIASLDVARRQMALEGYRITERAIGLANLFRRSIKNKAILKKHFRTIDLRLDSSFESIDEITFANEQSNLNLESTPMSYDPTKVVLDVSRTGMDGAMFREVLMNRYGIQVNKTSAKTVLFIINIGVSYEQIQYLLQVLTQIASNLRDTSAARRPEINYQSIIRRREFSPKHTSFIGKTHQALMIRQAYYEPFTNEECFYIPLNRELIANIEAGVNYYSAAFVTPYPPGYPVLLPAQKVTRDIAWYLFTLEIREIHGLDKTKGIKVFCIPSNESTPKLGHPLQEAYSETF